MTYNNLVGTAVHVGDSIRTPFGVTRVLKVDDESMTFRTLMGTWGLDEVFLVERPDGLEATLAWLDGPRLEVRTVTRVLTERCECSCGCKMQYTIGPDGMPLDQSHLATFGCNCSRCPCIVEDI